MNAEEVEVFRTNNMVLPPNAPVYQGAGCRTCNGAGFKGRLGIHELLVVDDTVRGVMLKELTADSVRDAAVVKSPQKMRTILMDGLQKVLEGGTTVREVLGGASEEAEDAAKKAAH
jgi:type IV pilus assembly protein PilB